MGSLIFAPKEEGLESSSESASTFSSLLKINGIEIKSENKGSSEELNFIKNSLNGSFSIYSLELPIDAESMIIDAKEIKITDDLGYSFNIFNDALVQGFSGRILLKEGNLYMTGSIKSVKSNDVFIGLKPKIEATIEVIFGSIAIESAKIAYLNAITAGKMRLNEKIDIRLANDEATLKEFEGRFRLDSNGNANLYGKVDSINVNGQSFTVLAR